MGSGAALAGDDGGDWKAAVHAARTAARTAATTAADNMRPASEAATGSHEPLPRRRQ